MDWGKSFVCSVKCTEISKQIQTDIFEEGSEGNKSLRKIRKVHKSVRHKAKDSLKEQQTPISQTDLSQTLIGFVMLILISPKFYGVEKRDQEMKGFIHMWRVFGYLHGIDMGLSQNTFDLSNEKKYKRNDPWQTINSIHSTVMIRKHLKRQFGLFSRLVSSLRYMIRQKNLCKSISLSLVRKFLILPYNRQMAEAICEWAGSFNVFFC